MNKAEPRTILHFLWNHFDLIRDLFDVQSREGLIRKESLIAIIDKHGKEIKQHLIDYQILKQSNDDYEMREAFFGLLEFILLEFRPLLPEEVSKFGNSISDLFAKIIDGIGGDKNILLDRIRAISVEIKNFSESVEKNSIRLLKETRELKSNVGRIGYQEKIQKASFWIEYYIAPLNSILDVNHSESITNKLLEISGYANQKQISITDEGVRQAFHQLYFLLRHANDDLLKQSKILTNDLLPLIERIKTENIILTGWIEFLKKPHKAKTPLLLKTFAHRPYSDKMVFSAREYFEQYLNSGTTYIEDNEEVEVRWVFNKRKYKNRLMKDLPVTNYFEWCFNQLNNETAQVSNDKIFAMTSLLFDEQVEVEFDEDESMLSIKTQTSILKVPKIKLKRNGVS